MFSDLEKSLFSKVATDLEIIRTCRFVEREKARNGAAFIATCRSFNLGLPKIIILNLDQPSRFWEQLTDDLKAHPTWRYIPIMGFGEFEDNDDILRFYSRGGGSCIRKPRGYESLSDVTKKSMEYWLNVSALPCDYLDDDHASEKR